MPIDFRELVKKGVHFGHQTSRWCPKMAPYIWGHKNKTHLFDVSKTAFQLEKAAQFLENIASQGKSILWVGTKRAAQEVIQRVGTELGMPYVNHRWIGGTLSNYAQVKKSVTKLLHFEDILSKYEATKDQEENALNYTKKEVNLLNKKTARLKKSVGGIRALIWPIGAVVLTDIGKEMSALHEAHLMGIPIVALVDSNYDPHLVTYTIPGNDDSPLSIETVVVYLFEGAQRGKTVAATIKKQEALSTQEAAQEGLMSDVAGALSLVVEEEEQTSAASGKKTTKTPIPTKSSPSAHKKTRTYEQPT